MAVAENQETNTPPSIKHVASAYSQTSDAPSPAQQANGTTSSKRLIWSIIGVIIFALLTIAVVVWWDQVKLLIGFISDQEAFATYLQSFGLLGPLVLFAAQFLQVIFAFIPGHVVVIAGGYVYGFALGLLMNITFTVTASQCAYLLARWLGRPIVYRLANRETIDYWERIANQKGVIFFTIAFILPIFPSDAMNFVAGLSGISARRFLVANFFGRLPSVIMLTAIGAYGVEFSNWMWGLIISIFLFFFIAGRFVFRYIKGTVDHEQQVGES